MRLFALPLLVCSLMATIALSPHLPAQTSPHPENDRVTSLITQAWKSWEEGGMEAAAKKLREAIAADPGSPRPYLLLSYLYAMERRQLSAWRAYDTALTLLPNRFPYLYAAWKTPKLDGYISYDSATVRRTITELARSADSLGVMRPMAMDALALARVTENDLDGGIEEWGAIGAVRDWMLIGPFDNVSSSGYGKVYPPELGMDTSARYRGKNGIPVWWITPAVKALDTWVHFNNYFTEAGATYYANTFIYSPTRRQAEIRIGAEGSVKAFLNDEVIVQQPEEYDADLDAYIAEVTLQEGWNRVLVKCGASSNDGDYSNPEFDKLINEAAAQTDASAANAKYQEAEKLLAGDMPAIPLWYGTATFGWSDKVTGVKITAFGTIDFASLALK